MRPLALLLLLPALLAAQGAFVIGQVRDSSGGEPLSRVSVRIAESLSAVTDVDGKFSIGPIAPGDYTLTVATVGYHVITRPFTIAPDEHREFEITLSPDNLRRTDTIDVTAGPLETERSDSPDAIALAGNDLKNLASVLADDPLRAVSGLPGVTSNNDFDARFSIRGADYNRVGLYLDDVLLHEPFHMLQSQSVTGSGTAFNGSMIDRLELHEGAPPERFGDRSAGALDVHLRDGNRSDNAFQFEASASNAGFLSEGPIGKHRKGSWLVGARKSYLQYLVNRIDTGGTSLVFGMADAQGRATYDLNPHHSFSLYALQSYSNLDRTSGSFILGLNSLAKAAYNYTLLNAGWKWTPSAKFAAVTHFAWTREKFDNFSPNRAWLGHGFYGEWTSNINAGWSWSRSGALDFGYSGRTVRDWGLNAQFQSINVPRFLNYYDGTARIDGAFVQQSWNALRGALHVVAGVRADRHSVDSIAVILPSLSAALAVTQTTRIVLAWGQYAQFPELSVLDSGPPASRRLLPLRSDHSVAAVEKRLSERMQLRAEFYDRIDRDLPFQPGVAPRFIGPSLYIPAVSPPWTNSLRGYSRGAEIYLRRSSANGFDGWISWAYGRTGMRDGVTGSRFPSDFDQRHTINVFATKRLSPSVSVSARASYGSGFPIPEYLELRNGIYFIGAAKNQLRMPYYQRTDLRINKSWTRNKWKIALFGEIINVTNRSNLIFDSLNTYNRTTGQTSITLDSMLPIIPSVGLLIDR